MFEVKINSVVDIEVENNVIKARIFNKTSQFIAYPFNNQRVIYLYDEHGYEKIENVENLKRTIRFCPEEKGEYHIELFDKDDIIIKTESFNVVDSSNQSKLRIVNGEAFFSDGKYFLPIGINLAFPESFKASAGKEFQTNNKVLFLGIRQYETWIKNCSKNGVNLIRIWCGSAYFSPDKEELGQYEYSQFAKLDKIFELANKYKIRIKLTIEKFRHFLGQKDITPFEGQASTGSIFDVYHTYQGETVTDATWLKENKYRETWCLKLQEYAKRYACNPALYAIEFWNEMNCYSNGAVSVEDLNNWNRYMSDYARLLFPNTLILNSFGSLDCQWVLDLYNSFCFEKFDLLQFHSYLDQGAEYEEVRDNPIEAIRKTTGLLTRKSQECGKRLFLAETGAVNDNHTGPFRYYSLDNDGLLFVDCVYTPLFLGCLGTGNMWFWDNRYVATKNLYKFFNPISKLTAGIDFLKEDFVAIDLSNELFYCFVLKGKTQYLAFLRNKQWNWKNTLRDGKVGKSVSGEICFTPINAKDCEIVKIWSKENDRIVLKENILSVEKLARGVLLKGKVKNSNKE